MQKLKTTENSTSEIAVQRVNKTQAICWTGNVSITITKTKQIYKQTCTTFLFCMRVTSPWGLTLVSFPACCAPESQTYLHPNAWCLIKLQTDSLDLLWLKTSNSALGREKSRNRHVTVVMLFMVKWFPLSWNAFSYKFLHNFKK